MVLQAKPVEIIENISVYISVQVSLIFQFILRLCDMFAVYLDVEVDII